MRNTELLSITECFVASLSRITTCVAQQEMLTLGYVAMLVILINRGTLGCIPFSVKCSRALIVSSNFLYHPATWLVDRFHLDAEFMDFMYVKE